MPYPGPWIQPPDQAGALFRRLAWGQEIDLTFPYVGGSYPPYPTTSASPLQDGAAAAWTLGLRDDIPDGLGTPDTWHLTVAEGTLGMDVQWQIDNLASTIMPPVPPLTLPPNAVDWEYEGGADAGTPTGTIDLSASLEFRSEHSLPDNVSTAPSPTDVDLSTMRIYRLRAYTWDRSLPTFPRALPTTWINGATATTLELIADIAVSDGTGMQPFNGWGTEPTSDWVGNPGGTNYDWATTISLADLDTNGSYTLVVLPSLLIDEATPVLPNAVNTFGQLVGASLTATQRFGGDIFVVGNIHYRPPRYRFLYAGRPPLAHRQRRDGTSTAGPQLAHIGTAGGRPSLAWRQNNP